MTQTLRRALERLYPALDSFFHPTNSVDGPTVIWLSSSLLFILATLCILLKHDAKDLEKGHAKHSSVLQPTSGQKRSPRYSPIPASTQALLTLLTPTKASRSTEYMPILHELISCLCLHSKVIFLDFTKVVQAICDDSELEFRNPSNFSIGAALGDEDDNDGGDLKHLFTQDFVSYGWKIVVVPSFWLSCKVMIWILESYTLDWRFLNPTEGLIGGRDWVGATGLYRLALQVGCLSSLT
ncbi:hypothetical protein AX16_008877 [Volvariella volvacea WC 439]|nr:hypothetical protein AX16_008877 [Volvariella volvacea WC 439]